MTRWLAGSFDPDRRASSAQLPRALDPHAATLLEAGPLKVAYSGATAEQRAPLCLLDGYLDNAEELAGALGHPSGTSPEGLLAAGWRRWGRELPPRMRGDFALVIWDEDRGEGLLARDQLGVRSMFLHDAYGPLCFASEVRHLLAALPRRPSPDPVSVAHWITKSNRPGSATLYAGIRRLNPGSALVLDRSGAHEVRYWAPRYVEPVKASASQLITQVRDSLDRAIALRVSTDELTGVLMSGGLDSSSVAAVAATQAPGRVLAQSAVFPDHPGVDESDLIGELREVLQLAGMTAEVRPGGMLASALASIEDWEMPLISWGDFWAVPLLRAAADAGVGVVLGGDGGDELFGTRTYLLADRLRAGHPLQTLALIRELPGAGDRPARRDIASIFARIAVGGALPYRAHELLRRASSRRDAPPWLLEPVADGLRHDDDPLGWKRADGPRWWAETAHVLTRGVEELGLFEHQRRRAATAGLQARHPLFDLDLVELCLSIAPQASFDRYRSRPLLRAAMAGLLPDSVRMRPEKALFDSLLIDSMAGPDGAIVRELLCDPNAEIRAYVDQAAMERSLFGAAERDFSWMWQLWRLLTAECWLRAQHGAGAIEALVARASAADVQLQQAPNPAAEAR
jgi:asparagine synthase (glutamine-hydrolysing)